MLVNDVPTNERGVFLLGELRKGVTFHGEAHSERCAMHAMIKVQLICNLPSSPGISGNLHLVWISGTRQSSISSPLHLCDKTL